MSAENIKYIPAPADLALRLQGAFHREATPPTEAAVVQEHFPDVAGPDRYAHHIAFVQAANKDRRPTDVLGNHTEDRRPKVLKGIIQRTIVEAMRPVPQQGSQTREGQPTLQTRGAETVVYSQPAPVRRIR